MFVGPGLGALVDEVHAAIRGLLSDELQRWRRVVIEAGPYFGTRALLLADEAGRLCPHCRAGVPHHANAEFSIGGPRTRIVWDLHVVEDSGGVGLAECLAGDLWLRAERRQG